MRMYSSSLILVTVIQQKSLYSNKMKKTGLLHMMLSWNFVVPVSHLEIDFKNWKSVDCISTPHRLEGYFFNTFRVTCQLHGWICVVSYFLWYTVSPRRLQVALLWLQVHKNHSLNRLFASGKHRVYLGCFCLQMYIFRVGDFSQKCMPFTLSPSLVVQRDCFNSWRGGRRRLPSLVTQEQLELEGIWSKRTRTCAIKIRNLKSSSNCELTLQGWNWNHYLY